MEEEGKGKGAKREVVTGEGIAPSLFHFWLQDWLIQ